LLTSFIVKAQQEFEVPLTPLQTDIAEKISLLSAAKEKQSMKIEKLNQELNETKSRFTTEKSNNNALLKEINFLEKEKKKIENIKESLLNQLEEKIWLLKFEKDSSYEKLDILQKKITAIENIADSLRMEVSILKWQDLLFSQTLSHFSQQLFFVEKGNKIILSSLLFDKPLKYKKIKKKTVFFEFILPATEKDIKNKQVLISINSFRSNSLLDQSFNAAIHFKKINKLIFGDFNEDENTYPKYYLATVTISSSNTKAFFRKGNHFYKVRLDNRILSSGVLDIY